MRMLSLDRATDAAIRKLKPLFYLLSILVDGEALLDIGRCDGAGRR